ncbi:TonB-dependent receptor [Prevotella cerevisiae]|uniref:TonB-dependent receptor n=1 Tax=Segatella cerevisiae TaxID=2053716 RepID=A0ABT1BXK8_9BACT|nr:TonB-dependent receptor [Segatella cerevisiae]MCO6025786.1 TonB-dependent receptor [Segatella cerevisiae]
MGKKKKVFLLVIMLTFQVVVHAQKIIVSGKVQDNNGPLPGASVSVKGKNKSATITDADGIYKIEVDPHATLLVHYIGFQSKEIPILGKSHIDILLTSEDNTLNEVTITIPYGTAKKSTFTGSAGFIDEKTIKKELVSNVSKALQGTVPGLQSFSSTGQPGTDASIYIRGVGSVNASSSPLYVVDGVPYQGTLSSISPEDIESITVLKDAASAALYGSRAANGVIMIVTKQGSQGQAPSINLSAKYGWSSRARSDYKQLTTDQYYQLYWEAIRNQRLDSGYNLEDADSYASKNLVGALGINPYGSAYPQPVGTDGKLVKGATPLWNDNWDKALTQNAHFQQYDLSVSGGNRSSAYYFSAGYLNDEGAYIQSGFKRYTFRANISSQVKKWLQLGLNINGTHSSQKYPKQDDSSTDNIITFARDMQSFYPIYQRNLETGEYLLDEDGNRIWDLGSYRPNSYSNQNLVATMPHDKSDIIRNDLSVRSFLELKPLKDWSYKLTINYDYDNSTDRNYVNPEIGIGTTTGGSINKENIQASAFTINNVVNYTHSFSSLHNLHALIGQEYYEYHTSNFGGTRTNVIADGFYEPDAASTLSSFTGNSDAYKLLSYFGSAEYNYDRRYYLSASIRSDGSSRFAPKKRWGTFWSVGGSWKISEESFMKNTKSWLYNLGLRASYGAQGNDNVGYYAYQELYSIANNLGESGVIASRLATPNLSWETNLNLNIALDFGLWNNRLNGSIEFFVRHSKDLLFSLNLVPSSGYTDMDANIGAMRNVGWEFQLNGQPIKSRDWEWNVSLNATTYKNTITSLPSDVMWSGDKKWVKGGSLYDWYLIEWAGVNPKDGNPQWYGIDDKGQKYTTEDYSSLTADDKVKSGSSLPDVTGGIQSSLNYKNWSFSMFFSYSLGGKIYNGDKVSLLSQGPSGTGWSADMLNRWTPENTQTDIPRLTTEPASSWTNTSSRFLVSRDYLKLKNISLGYTLPKQWFQRLGLQEATLNLTAENLLTWAAQQGLDPEQNIGGTTYYRYPSMKSITMGINVKF